MNVGPSLTEEQLAAVEASDGPYVVVAPPGSGKTEVLIRRVLWLVARSAGEPFRVLALAYTNKAADELRARAQAVLGDDAWRVTATTLHAFCVDMLQRYGESVGVSGEVSVYDTDDLRLDLFEEALAGAGYDMLADRDSLTNALKRIDDLRLKLVPPDLAPGDLVLDGTLELDEAYQAYEDALDDARALDFPAMLFRGWRLLTEDPWVGAHYRRQYRHILLDEAQDLTLAQIEILRALCSDELRNIFIVADEDQEIFSFAGSSSENYAAFAKEVGATQLFLTTNFRSAQAIVAAAERLREHFHTIRVRRLSVTTSTPAPGWVGAQAFSNLNEEGQGVATWVADLLRDNLRPEWLHEGEDPHLEPEDVCIMARTRWAFDPIIGALEQQDVNYVVRTEEGGLFDSVAGRAVYLALRVLANPRDRASTRRLASLLDQAGEPTEASEEVPHFDAFEVQEDSPDRGWMSSTLGLPVELATMINLDATEDSLRDLLLRVKAALPVGDLAHNEADTREADLWEADRARLADHWDRYAALTRVHDRSLAGFLRQLSRLQRTPPEAPGVRLLTPYRAKGLQFRVVIITGMNEGSFPHYRATTDRAIDEERRAVYVGLTRAARAALLTRATQRTDRWGRVHRDPPSRFLAEAGLLS